MRFLLAILTVFTLFHSVPALAQTKDTHGLIQCEGRTRPEDIIAQDKVFLAFTGGVLKQDAPVTWFRVFKVHKGEDPGKIVSALGYGGNRAVVIGQRDSYVPGQIYTIAVREPEEGPERHYGVNYINALDICEERVISRVHEHYGQFYLTSKDLEAGKDDDFGGSNIFHRNLFLLLLSAALLAGLIYTRDQRSEQNEIRRKEEEARRKAEEDSIFIPDHIPTADNAPKKPPPKGRTRR